MTDFPFAKRVIFTDCGYLRSMDSSDVTTVIPVFNGRRYLREALESVRAQSAGEIIVVEDGSSEPSEDIAWSVEGVRYLQHREPRGPAAARNTGILASESPLIAFLDADDVWEACKTTEQLALMNAHDAEIVLGKLRFWHSPPAPEDASAHLSYSFGSGLFRRHVFHTVGPIDESLRFGEDTEWFLKAREMRVSLCVQDRVVLNYRRHDTNMTLERSAEERGEHLFGVLRRSLGRRQNRQLCDLGAQQTVPSACE